METKHLHTSSNLGSTASMKGQEIPLDPQQILTRLNFGRVDGETDNRFDHCFIGTEMLRQVLLPQHSLLVGHKGSGKSAICRLLCEDLQKVRPLLPREYDEIYCIPAYGLQSEEELSGLDFRELRPSSTDEFRYFWLLYLGLKTATTLLNDEKLRTLVQKSSSKELKDTYETLKQMVGDVGLGEKKRGLFTRLTQRIGIGNRYRNQHRELSNQNSEKPLGVEFKSKTGMSIIALLTTIDTILQETNSVAWIMLDKLDLLYVEDIEKLRAAITGLIQLLVQYGNQFNNIHFKIFLRNDIYRQLHIVNKSHLVSYTTEMKWKGTLLLKLLVSRAVVDPNVRSYCEKQLGEKVDVTDVILGTDEYVLKVFYSIFEPTMSTAPMSDPLAPSTHTWILKRLVDGMGNSFPRELIHLGNMAVDKQREMNRQTGKHLSNRLISAQALKEAFKLVSRYRCDTYLYAEFPHLTKHFDVFRGSDSATFHREELYMLFEPLVPKGDDALRAVYDAGLIMPLGKNVDSCREFKVPLLYRAGLGITERRHRPQQSQPKKLENFDELDGEEVPVEYKGSSTGRL